jgi:hypothetical protein
MIDEIKEIAELSKIVLDSMDINNEEAFKVETMPAPLNILLESDTMVPVIALYCNHMGKILFNDENIYSQRLYQTPDSLFYIKMENNKSSENFVATHIKILLIKKFFSSLVDKNREFDLTKLVNTWREVLTNKSKDETISLQFSEDGYPLTNKEISNLFNLVTYYNI